MITQIEPLKLRNKIVYSLRKQGFNISKSEISPPENPSKDTIRKLHEIAVQHRVATAKKSLCSSELKLLEFIADGNEIDPNKIQPKLVEVKPDTTEELLFRYACLHWSIPISSGYGRRIRFLVFDESNDKLMGLIGLGDPVFGLAARDKWIGWTIEDRRERLRYVMDAFVLGAVPPYSFLLCSKLIAMLAASDELRAAFRTKYSSSTSLISGKAHDGKLALITTTSALGRSSVYNRLRFYERLLFKSVGFTLGYGEFHFSNGIYNSLFHFATLKCMPTAKQQEWGNGFRNKREVVRKSLQMLGLSSNWVNHGIKREIFVVPLALNAVQFLCGKHKSIRPYNQNAEELFSFFRDRWMLPRSRTNDSYKTWRKENWLLWHDGGNRDV